MIKNYDLSPNYSKKTRKKDDIKFIILHYTGMQSEIASLKRLKDINSKVSSHYFINRKGKIHQLVKDNKIAWHAGKSKWKSMTNINKYSIGIELVNRGHMHGYEKFPKSQIISLIRLCKKLKIKYHIKNENFLGHSDIAPLRKIDPGEKFPWKKLSSNNIGNWHEVKKHDLKKLNNEKSRKLFFKNLHKVGYRYFNLKKNSKSDRKIIKAFQQRYLPSNISGKIDKKTFIISHFLANNDKNS